MDLLADEDLRLEFDDEDDDEHLWTNGRSVKDFF